MATTSLNNGKPKTPPPGAASQTVLRRNSEDEPIASNRTVNVDETREVNDGRSAATSRRQRTIMKTLVVGLGGSGIGAVSSMRGILNSQGTTHNVEFLALDTDETAQKGADGCPGFSDEEFVHLSCSRIGNVISNPEHHPMLNERLQLNSSSIRACMQRLVAEGVTQGGQVRRFGNLGLQSNYSRVRAALRHSIDRLTGAFSDLEKQLGATERIQLSRRLSIILVCSAAGGSGGSFLLDTGSILRSLTRNQDVDFTACIIMPSAFDNVMNGYPEQRLRMQANAYALFRELNAFTLGLGLRENVRVGPDERNSVPVTADLFNQIFVVSPEMADGRSIAGLRAVQHHLGMALATQFGTEACDHIALADANQATLRGHTPDRITKESRNISTLNGVALRLPVDRIAETSANRATELVLRKCVLGTHAHGEVASITEAWVTAPLPGKAESLKGDQLIRRFAGLALPNPTAVTRGLFRHASSSEKVHLRTSEFVDRARSTLHKFRGVQQGEIQERLREAAVLVSKECQVSLHLKFNELVARKGYLTALAFVEDLTSRLKREQSSTMANVEASSDRASTHLAQAESSLQQFNSLLRNRFRDSGRKNLAAGQIGEFIVASVKAASASAALEVITLTLGEAARLEASGRDVLVATKERLAQLQTIRKREQRNGLRVTTQFLAEIDIVTPEVEQELFKKFCPDTAELLQLLSAKLRLEMPETLRQTARSGQAFKCLKDLATSHFNQKLKSVTIVDVLADQLASPETAEPAIARIKAGIVGCQPLWNAESRHISTEFADTIIVGLPMSRNAANQERVSTALISGTTRWINPNGQYNGEATHVLTGDPHRIYVLRRTQGACLYYLPEMAECEAAYREWKAIGGHPVHIFNDDLVAKMPEVLPESPPH